MNDSVAGVFSATANSYDHARSRLVPGFDDLYRWAVELVPDDATEILDLGAGTGLLSAFLRRRRQRATLHLVDVSEPMLAKARERFEGDAAVTFQVGDYTTTALAGSFDAVVSALSIHHLTDAGKREVLLRSFGLLRPGGVFVNAEQVLGPTPALEKRYKEIWLRDVRALGATEEQISDSLLRQQQDQCASIEDQLAWMREIGFLDVDCWFKSGRFATMAGRKPALP